MWRSLTSYFSKIIKDRDVKCWHNIDSGLQILLSKFGINIFDNLKTMRSSASAVFFIITVDWRRNLKFIRKVWFRFIRVNLILNVTNIFEWWKSLIRWTNEILRIFCSFFSDYFQSSPILKFRWLCRINYMKIYQTLLSFIRSIYS